MYSTCMRLQRVTSSIGSNADDPDPESFNFTCCLLNYLVQTGPSIST